MQIYQWCPSQPTRAPKPHGPPGAPDGWQADQPGRPPAPVSALPPSLHAARCTKNHDGQSYAQQLYVLSSIWFPSATKRHHPIPPYGENCQWQRGRNGGSSWTQNTHSTARMAAQTARAMRHSELAMQSGPRRLRRVCEELFRLRGQMHRCSGIRTDSMDSIDPAAGQRDSRIKKRGGALSQAIRPPQAISSDGQHIPNSKSSTAIEWPWRRIPALLITRTAAASVITTRSKCPHFYFCVCLSFFIFFFFSLLGSHLLAFPPFFGSLDCYYCRCFLPLPLPV